MSFETEFNKAYSKAKENSDTSQEGKVEVFFKHFPRIVGSLNQTLLSNGYVLHRDEVEFMIKFDSAPSFEDEVEFKIWVREQVEAVEGKFGVQLFREIKSEMGSKRI